MAHHERMLRRGINGHALVVDLGDGDVRLHRVGIGHRKIIVAFDDRRRFFKSFFDIAPLDFMRLADIRAFTGGHFAFEAAQRAGFKLPLM